MALPLVALHEDDQGPIQFFGPKFAGQATLPDRMAVVQDPTLEDAIWLADGGVFANNPLDLVLARPADEPAQNGPATRRVAARDKVEVYFLDHHRKLSDAPPYRPKYGGTSLYVLTQNLLASVGDVLTSQQVVAALRRQRDLKVVGRHRPVLGDAGFATAGFLHRSFRELDYLSGHLDGQEHPGLAHKEPGPFKTWTSRALQALDEAHQGGCKYDAPFPGFHPPSPWGDLRCEIADASARRERQRTTNCRRARRKDDSPNPHAHQVSQLVKKGDASKSEEAALEACKVAANLDSLFEQFPPKSTEKETLQAEIQPRLDLLGERLDGLVEGQGGGLNLPGRILELGLELVLLDGLAPGEAPNEKGRRSLRPWQDGFFGGAIVGVRPYFGLEVSLRAPWAVNFLNSSNLAFGLGGPRLSLMGGLDGSGFGDLYLLGQGTFSFTLVAGRLGSVFQVKLNPATTLMSNDVRPVALWWGGGGLLRVDLLSGPYFEARLFHRIADRELAQFASWESQLALGWDF